MGKWNTFLVSLSTEKVFLITNEKVLCFTKCYEKSDTSCWTTIWSFLFKTLDEIQDDIKISQLKNIFLFRIIILQPLKMFSLSFNKIFNIEVYFRALNTDHVKVWVTKGIMIKVHCMMHNSYLTYLSLLTVKENLSSYFKNSNNIRVSLKESIVNLFYFQ